MWRLVTRNWSASPLRCAAAVVSIAVGVCIVTSITTVYETARYTIRNDVLARWLGSAHLTVFPPGAHWGTLSAALAESIAKLDNIESVTPGLTRRMRLSPAIRPEDTPPVAVDAVSYDYAPGSGARTLPGLEGALPQRGERGTVALERGTAEELGVALGQKVLLQQRTGSAALPLTVVGLFDSQRVAEFQRPVAYLAMADLQEIQAEIGQASSINIMLRDAAPLRIQEAEAAIEKLLSETPGASACKVESAAARIQLMDEADGMMQILLGIVAFVAMLTSFFIILTTMSMSLFERQPTFGVMRCVGLTRGQMVKLLFAELFPLGILGSILGIVGAWAAISIGSALLSDRLPPAIYTTRALSFAAASGMTSVILSALVLIFQILRVTPLTAINLRAKPTRTRPLLLLGVIGVALIATHEWQVRATTDTGWLEFGAIPLAVGSLYLGYALIVPALVVLLGPLAARAVAPILRLPAKLTVDQFGRAPWRSTGVCWVLMVGLSLLTYMSVNAESILAIWDFPSRLPGVFVWTADYAPRSAIERINNIPGVLETATTTDLDCKIEKVGAPAPVASGLLDMLYKRLLRPVFVAGDPDKLLSMLKVGFTQGNEKDALEKLRRGGYVLIPVATAKNLDLSLGDRVNITILEKVREFEVAGVIQSPAMDMAVTVFQATSYMQLAAATAMLGTQQDLRDKFGLDVISMVLGNLDIPDAPMPKSFHPRHLPRYQDDKAVAQAFLNWSHFMEFEQPQKQQFEMAVRQWMESGGTPSPEVQAIIHRYSRAIQRVAMNRDALRPDAWKMLRERILLMRIAEELGAPDAIIGSLVRMKENLRMNIRRATLAVSMLPILLLVIAVMGIANLMMVSIAVRARQIAMLRAIGLLKSQLIRLVLAEAIALALIGSVVGLLFGLHEAWSDNRMTATLIGFQPDYIVPPGGIALAVGLAILTCLLAAIAPARRAARGDIITALTTAG